MKESSASAWGNVMLALPFLFILCVSVCAETTKDVVGMVLKGETPATANPQGDLINAIQACPIDEAISLFMKAYEDGDEATQGRALWGLSVLPPDEKVTEALLKCSMSGKKTAAQARNRLENRELSRTLSPEESVSFAEAVQNGKDNMAGTAARNWAKLGPADPVQAAEIITEKYVSQVKDPMIGKSHVRGAYVTPRVFCLNQYLLAYRSLGESAQTSLRDALSKADNDDIRIWLTIALAMAGAKDAGLALEPLIRDVDAGSSMRVCATRGHAAALGEEARLLLTELLEDQAVTDYPEGKDELDKGKEPHRVVAGAARGELSKLDKAAAEKAGLATQ